MALAGFWLRLIAYLIDTVILGVVMLILIVVLVTLGATAYRDVLESDALQAGLFYLMVIPSLVFVINVAYFVLFWTTTGQTIGHMLLGLKVVSTDGDVIGPGKAIIRYIGYMVSGFFLYFGFLWVAFDSEKQGWHDKIAGTYVIRA